jgi:hypothetical protein
MSIEECFEKEKDFAEGKKEEKSAYIKKIESEID